MSHGIDGELLVCYC